MANQHQLYPMVLNGVLIGMLGLREDQIKYFNIPNPTPAEEALVHYNGSIKAHSRHIYSNRLDDTAPTRTKQISKVAVVPRDRSKSVNSRGGKAIKIPTQLTSTPEQNSTAANPTPRTPSIRFTTIKFPGAASNAEISRWLFTKCVGKKPTYFKTPAGASHPVVGGTIPTPDPAP